MSKPNQSRRRGQRPSPVMRAGVLAPAGFKLNARNKANGLDLLLALRDHATPLVFFDPQYRELLDRQGYGNEGERQVGRASLPQMSGATINTILDQIARVLRPSGHLMRWVDKFTLCEGLARAIDGLVLVDMITFRRNKLGMGRRSRYVGEYLMVYQRPPVIAKGVWRDHTIADVQFEPHGWEEQYLGGRANHHPHRKPVWLQARLIKAVTKPGDVVVDPSAGSYSVLDAARFVGRNFLGCDLR